jgi:hypothetical protein
MDSLSTTANNQRKRVEIGFPSIASLFYHTYTLSPAAAWHARLHIKRKKSVGFLVKPTALREVYHYIHTLI